MRWTMTMMLALAGCEPEDAARPGDTGDTDAPRECPPSNRYAWLGTECFDGWALAHQVLFFHRAGTDDCKFWAKDGGDWSIVLDTLEPDGDAWVMRGGKRLARGTWTVQPGTETTPEVVLLRLPPARDDWALAPFTCPDGDGIAVFAPTH